MITGLYIPGGSLLHRLPAGVKLTLLVVAGLGITLIDTVLTLSVTALAVVAAYPFAARLGWQPVWRATKAILIWLFFIAVAQALIADLTAAATTVLRLLILVWTASLVTYTTRLEDMMSVLERVLVWARPLGVSPQRSAFMIALTIRLIPALFDLAREVREAQRARGVEASVVTAVAPSLTRVLAHADTVSEALIARGYDRWDAPR